MKKKKCKCVKKRKHLPYGTNALTGYCFICDCGLHLDVSKSNERNRAKKQIRKELESEGK